MQGITRWVLIFDAKRFSQKNCAHRRGLLTAFSISVLGVPGVCMPVFPIARANSLLFFQVFVRQQERRPAGG
jgi:hypothetical protein